MKDKILYITYDGLSDPLGQSQILPYITGLAERSYSFSVISCEKPGNIGANNIYGLRENEHGIDWHPLPYTKKPPVLSTVWDIYRIKKLAASLHKSRQFSVVHCRSYIAAFAGLFLKKKYGVKLIFDMRGFWADERMEGGLWSRNNPVYRTIYNYFKKKEKEYLLAADYTVTLSGKAKKDIQRRPGLADIPVKVIPCCADTELFDRERLTPEGVESFRNKLGIPRQDFVITYLGAIGTWYMLDEMLGFFKVLLQSKPYARFLFITPESPLVILKSAEEKGIRPEHIITVSAKRHEVPYLLSLADIGIYFIRPTYSKIASSPTKLAELLSMGIPVICNTGIGDSDTVLEESKCGLLVNSFTEEEYRSVAARMDGLLSSDKSHIRNTALKHFSLEMGISKYEEVYRSLIDDE